jgi:hypothetical protein
VTRLLRHDHIAVRNSQCHRVDVVDGLPFGHYTVSARQAGQVSEAADVAVDPDQPEGMVRLTLRPRASRLTVADGTGRPVTGLAFGPMGVRVEADKVPGVYLLDYVPPGVRLLIRARTRFVPVCRVVRSDADLEVKLENGQAVTVDIALPSLQPSDAFRLTFTGIDGADCPVPFAEFDPVLLGAADGVARYYLPQFPRSGNVSAGTEERHQRVIVQDGMAVIRMR